MCYTSPVNVLKGKGTMKKLLACLLIFGLLASANTLLAFSEGDCEYFGYSDDMRDFIAENTGLFQTKAQKKAEERAAKKAAQEAAALAARQGKNSCINCPEHCGGVHSSLPAAKEQIISEALTEEADYTTEQLKELAVTRSIDPNQPSNALGIHSKVYSYWDYMSPAEGPQPLSEDIKQAIKENMAYALQQKGYQIVQLELLPLPENNPQEALRALVRVTKPLKSRRSYKEIQGNLSEIKKVCATAATLDGKNYLSEMTTFIAENPSNQYYYEKTILH